VKGYIPYFNFYPADFMNGVRGMTAQEVGVYTMLLCRMYEESSPVQRNDLRLSTYCGMRESTFSKTLDRLIALGKILDRPEGLINPRAETEISKRADGLKINSKAGKASAEKRQQNQQNDSTTVQRPFNQAEADTDTEATTSVVAAALEAPQIQSEDGPSDREKLLSAMGVDSSGMTGPNGHRIGTMADMATAAKWLELLTIDEQCRLISERVAAAKAKSPGFAPRSFGYFTAAMADFAALKAKPMPQGVAGGAKSGRDAQLARWAALGRKSA
jgi:uncharacterized protein YdaU (DUF1376 family)